jgi:hypothetical protein
MSSKMSTIFYIYPQDVANEKVFLNIAALGSLLKSAKNKTKNLGY